MVVPGFSDPVIIAQGGDLFVDPIAVFGVNGPEIEAAPCSPADTDGDGTIDLFDLIAFLQNFDPSAECPTTPACAVADIDNNNAIDVFDLIAFLQAFDPNDPACQTR